MRLIARCT